MASKMKLSDSAVADLKSEWAGVVKMRARMKALVVGTFAGGAITGVGVRVLYNLPLLLAFDVLKQTLAKASDEQLFWCSSKRLGALMDSSQNALPWIDWPALREGVRRRNEVAHDGILFDGKECLEDIDRIETQLIAWQIIDSAAAE